MAGAVVIGIDPGSVRTGWGVVREDGTGLSLIDCGIIRTTSGGRKEFSERLAFIYHELTAVLDRLKPEEAAIEDVFQAKNASSALKLGQARGTASQRKRLSSYAGQADYRGSRWCREGTGCVHGAHHARRA